ncbi:MAG: hypothetical protein JNM27_02300 [Leptospirales bacterium]|nr:hypothetical protein [Leptospirales bacterium]
MMKFTFRAPDDDLMQKVRENLRSFLAKQGLRACAHIIETVLSELVQNALKANLKRSYFLENKLHIKRDYAQGNQSFRKMLAEDSRGLIALAAKHRHEVRVTFRLEKEILISVWNPAIAVAERERIRKSLTQKKIKPGSDELAEGAGMGLTMAAALLRSLGLAGALGFTAGKSGGRFTISIPKNVQARSAAGRKVIRFIQKRLPLPVLPETVQKLKLTVHDDKLLRLLASEDPALFINISGKISARSFKKKKVAAVASSDARLLANQALRLTRAARRIAASKKVSPEKAVNAAIVDSIGLYFLYSLKPTDLNELRKITGRNRPTVEPALRESTVGINPEVLSGLLLTSAGLSIQPMRDLLNEARISMEND